MIPTGLIKALADEVREATKDYVMKAEGQEDKKVSVYCQHIPDEDFQTDTYYPLVIISVQDVARKLNRTRAIITLGLPRQR